MPRTTWWLRTVGALYLILTIANLAMLTVSPDVLRETLPFEADDLAFRAFGDAWLVFVLELGALGGAMLAASWRPAESRTLIWAIIAAEVFRGIVADAIWIAGGYSAGVYVPFIILHAVVIATGIWALRSERSRFATVRGE